MISKLEILLIKTYRAFSHPIYDALDKAHINYFKCKYNPSCSHYAEEAIKKYGWKKGAIMAVKRIARCNPSARGGYDPVE